MKLYYAAGACSLSPHVALREAGLPFDLVRVDFMRGKTLPDGTPFASVNPKGYVPALELDDGRLLTENAAIIQYIADLVPDAKLAPPAGTFERVRLQEWLVFIATELHKGVGPLFSPKVGDYKDVVKERLVQRFGILSSALEGKRWLMGDDFTIADGYALYAIRAWEKVAQVNLDEYPTLAAYKKRIEERPAVRAALDAEGLK
ncbi:MAG TPA: glutathione transferase GstA [Labilithrix sp.]|nr:glutathione transferase GstA [Labilithrix sp.]